MIDETNEFQYFHSYRRLVNESKAPALRCPCGAEYVTLSEDYRLVLWCPADDITLEPGQLTLHRVQQAVDYFEGEK